MAYLLTAVVAITVVCYFRVVRRRDKWVLEIKSVFDLLQVGTHDLSCKGKMPREERSWLEGANLFMHRSRAVANNAGAKQRPHHFEVRTREVTPFVETLVRALGRQPFDIRVCREWR